jgi:hypothetical protein
MGQTSKSVCIGMGAVGKKRLRLYLQGIKARGYTSFSAYVVDLVDKELAIKLPKPPRRNSSQPVKQKAKEN